MSKYWYGQPGYVKSWDCANLTYHWTPTVNGSIIMFRTHSIYSLCRLIWRDEKFSLYISDGQQNIQFLQFYKKFHTNYYFSHMLTAASEPTELNLRISPLGTGLEFNQIDPIIISNMYIFEIQHNLIPTDNLPELLLKLLM